jgi:pilus assembly protein CpaE
MLWPALGERRKSVIGRVLATWPDLPPQLKPGI